MANLSRAALIALLSGTNVDLTSALTNIINSCANVNDDKVGGIPSVSGSISVYRALMTQSGTSAPTAQIITNTLGYVPTWHYDEVGGYHIQFTSDVDVTTFFVNALPTANGASYFIQIETDDFPDNVVTFFSYDDSGDAIDNSQWYVELFVTKS